jgi:hypothetical protein
MKGFFLFICAYEGMLNSFFSTTEQAYYFNSKELKKYQVPQRSRTCPKVHLYPTEVRTGSGSAKGSRNGNKRLCGPREAMQGLEESVV